MKLNLQNALMNGTKKHEHTLFFSDVSFYYIEPLEFYVAVNGNERVLRYIDNFMFLYREELQSDLFSVSSPRDYGKSKDGVQIYIFNDNDEALKVALHIIERLGAGSISSTADDYINAEQSFFERHRTWVTEERLHNLSKLFKATESFEDKVKLFIEVDRSYDDRDEGTVMDIDKDLRMFGTRYRDIIMANSIDPVLYNPKEHAYFSGMMGQAHNGTHVTYAPAQGMKPTDLLTVDEYVNQMLTTAIDFGASNTNIFGVSRHVETNKA